MNSSSTQKLINSQAQREKIAIAATFTAEPIEESLNFWLQELKTNSQVEFAPYNQVFQQLLDPNSLFANNHQGINVILVRFEDWQRFEDTAAEKFQLFHVNNEKIRQTTQELIVALKSAAENSSTPYLVIVCPASPMVAASPDSQALFQEMETLLESEINYLSSIYLIKSSEIFPTYPVENYYDSRGDKLGHIPFTNLFFTALGTLITRKIYTLKNPPYKVIVLDCDQTLWQGVCGEDGAMGIKIDTPWKNLQEFMVAQYEAGMLICLCSKNIEADVIEVFERRPEMPLKREHIVSWRINWQLKSENIKSLAAELNLGLDSFIFIDDNPIECSEVKLNCPEVFTLQLPENSEDIPRFLNHVWAFERLKTTTEDQKRTELYKQNIQRENLRSDSLSFQEFLDKLALKVNITKMQPSQLARVSQLTQRTNQFNATTIRRSEAEIKTLCQSQNYECLVVDVKDRFGDYGLVGVIIFELRDNSIVVDTFLLSCRVLGRGVEHRMLAELGNIAQKNGLIHVDVPYIPSAKNEPLLNFINSVGEKFAQPQNDGFIYHFPTEFVKELTYKPATSQKTVNKNNKDKDQQATVSSKSIDSSVNNESKSIQLSRIANELYSAEQVLQIIESQTRDRCKLQQTYVSPRSKIEQQLADLWTRLLHIDRVGIYDNFFDLGGNSLVAVSLFSQIEEKFNKSFPLSILLKAPTVEQLAQFIEQERQNTQQSLLLPIQVGTPEKTPFFGVHGGFGDVLYYQELAKELGCDQPFYGIQPLGLDGKSSPLTRVEEMAAYYIKEIRTVQPVGPYFLGGMCMGGIIALEIAQQLQAQNQQVAFLGLLDPPHPRPMSFVRYCQVRFDYYFQHYFSISFNYHTSQLLKLSPQEKMSYILGQINQLKQKIKSKFFKVNSQKMQTQTKTVNSQKKQFPTNNNSSNNSMDAMITTSPQGAKNKVFESNMQALRSYCPSNYSGIVTLFIAEEAPKQQVHSSQIAWEKLVTGKVETYLVPGSHRTMMKKPYVNKLAEKLRLGLK